jgi:hypothetical protein
MYRIRQLFPRGKFAAIVMARPSKKPAEKPQEQKLSLHGMTPEEALRKALSTPPPKPKKPPKTDPDTAR